MNQQNIDTLIQNLFLDFNNKEYQKVIDSSLKLIEQNYRITVIFNLLGTSYYLLKKYEKALNYYYEGINLDPDNDEINRNIGKCYLSQKKYKDAEIFFNKALNIKKDNPDALFNLGLIKILSNEINKAIQFLNRALNSRPNFTECIYNLGICYKNLGDFKTAINYYLKVIEINPNHLKAYNNLGVCYLILNDHNNALNILNKCLAKNPNYSFAYNNLGSVYVALKNFKDAEVFFEKAYSLNKNLLNAGIQKIYLKRRQFDWSSENEISSIMLDSVRLDTDVIPWQCFGMEDNPENHLIRATKYSRKFKLKSENLHVYNNDKIRIGYFASDFYHHPGMINMLGIFKSHDRNKFQIIGFYYGEIKKDEMHYRIKESFDEFYYVDKLNDKEIAELSKKNKIDIAVNRSGHTDKARGNIFSYKPAPIQINYLGYPGTLGQEGIDYIIADRFVIPKEYENFFSEKIIYLSDSFYPKDQSRVISSKKFSRNNLGISKNSFVYCSFNNSYKITSEELKIWGNILGNVKDSYLLLLSNNEEMKENLTGELIKNKINPAQVKFLDYLSFQDHMARHEICDLFLDSFNINAHTSAVDSLWAGLPILTKVGKSFCSRICGSILQSVGFNELITYSTNEYEIKAIYFGRNKGEINKIKNKIIKLKKQKKFYDIKKYTRKLEKAFEKAHSLRLKNKQPTHFEIQ